MLRRFVLVSAVVFATKFTLIQTAMLLLTLFFGVAIQIFARPFYRLTADHLDFVQVNRILKPVGALSP